MSRAKLTDALMRRWNDAEAVQHVIQQLAKARILDDAAFAQEAIRQELAKSPAAPPALVRRLATLGVDESIARREVDRALTDRDEKDDIRALARKRLNAMSPNLSPEAKARRLAGALARRGFDAELVHDVVREVCMSDTEIP